MGTGAPGTPLTQGIGLAPNNALLNEALWRYGGMHGKVLDLNGNLIHEAIELQAEVQIARITVPLAGTTREGHKAGRETREGSITIQKLDTAWEYDLWNWLRSRSVKGSSALQTPFSLIIDHSDPGQLGWEQWQLDGCLVWSIPLGMNIGDDIRQLQLPLTWEAETPLHGFTRTGAFGSDGLPAIKLIGALDAVTPVAA